VSALAGVEGVLFTLAPVPLLFPYLGTSLPIPFFVRMSGASLASVAAVLGTLMLFRKPAAGRFLGILALASCFFTAVLFGIGTVGEPLPLHNSVRSCWRCSSPGAVMHRVRHCGAERLPRFRRSAMPVSPCRTTQPSPGDVLNAEDFLIIVSNEAAIPRLIKELQ
jgi:hypothetical protein